MINTTQFVPDRWYRIQNRGFSVTGKLASLLPAGISREPTAKELFGAYVADRVMIGGEKRARPPSAAKFINWVDLNAEKFNVHDLRVCQKRAVELDHEGGS